jgi:hypothetical protein
MKRMYSVHFYARSEKGKEYLIDHVEDVYCEGTDSAVSLGLRRLPSEIMRRPITRVEAYRDMRR